MQTYKDLIVWQKSIELVVPVYELTDKFPKEELFGLTTQTKRTAISIPSNIAEGKMRGHEKEFKKFLLIAYGSGGELETQIEIAKKLPKTMNLDYSKVDNLLSEVMKMLNKMISSRNATANP